jgi:hypothetical protein
MPRQRQQGDKSRKPKSRAEESATQISKTKAGISTTIAETSGDPQYPSLSRRRSASAHIHSSGISSPIVQEEAPKMDMKNMSRRSQWLVLAVASGACAAFNGVFAKLYVAYLHILPVLLCI